MKKILLFASAVAVLLSSCSTDNTQDVIGNEAKMGTISANAAYQQNGTRTYLDEAGDVVWSKGDALGVFGQSGTQVQFGLVSGEGTTSGKFAGNLNYLKADKPVYAYYPYDRNADIDGSKATVFLAIAEKQTYLPVENPTFDAAQAPAFAYIKKLEDKENISFNFKGAASYLSFPVVGRGSLESLTLTIGDQNLAGSAAICVATEDKATTADVDETPALNVADMTIESVTVDCGGVILNPSTPIFVTFVVPVGVNLTEEITLDAVVSGTKVSDTRTITVAAGATAPKTTRNNGLNIWKDSKKNPWSFSPEGCFVIDDAVSAYGLEGAEVAALDFITYAYFAQADQPWDAVANEDGYNGPSMKDWETVSAMGYTAGQNSTTALVYADEIDFSEFNAEDVFGKLGAYTTESTLYPLITVYKNALTWYIKNGYAIESLNWGENGVAVIGYNEDQPSVINDLTVLGNGISASAGLENLKFTNSTVVVPETITDYVGFIAAKSDTAGIENVVIGAGNSIDVSNADYNVYFGGIYGWYQASHKVGVEVEELPSFTLGERPGSTWSLRGENATIEADIAAGQLFGDVFVDQHWVVDLEDYNFASLAERPIAYHVQANPNQVIDITATDDMGAAYNNVFVVNGTVEDGAFKASIVLNGTSYWTGEIETPNTDAYYTAEELAYAMQNGGNVVLTHNVDMQNEEIETNYTPTTKVASVSSSVKTPAKGQTPAEYNHFTIKNVNVKAKNSVALFGQSSKLANITVSNVVLNATKATQKVGGLAVAGSAENVVVDGLTINLGEFGLKEAANVGGVFATATPADLNNVEVTSYTVKYTGEEEISANGGVIVGKLTINPDDTETLNTIKLTGESGDYTSKGIGSQWGTANKKANFAADATYAGKYPFGVVYVANAEFSNSGKLKAYLDASKVKSHNARLAAGIVFADEMIADAAAKAGFDTSAEYKYALYINGGATIGKNACTVFGFEKAAPATEK